MVSSDAGGGVGIQRTIQPCRAAGFTLIESIVVLVVASTLLCVAVPSLRHMMVRHRVATAQMDLLASLQDARALAITSGRRALLCPAANGQQCSNDTHWEKGWLVGSYRSDKASQLDGPPTRIHGGYPQLIITSTGGRTRIRFQPTSFSGGSTVTFTLCQRGYAQEALAIKVSNYGRIAGAKPSQDEAMQCASGG
ncbi:GspH/FimT family pseudopilin [Dyella telluris]|uniref:Type II secretion system protein H n=1 Tax=Dyella telluris TaxID=2763498 RepID=A0A7G8Q0U9_9GAMM|nr:GspH/FimT family pseudopilin [Dyella telluris]QNK00407.1 GspH/FimT family pseudopilin [Dyella telluris]